MNCMKCGKETKGSAVFCPQCLAVMEKYPVKSDTPIHLPGRAVQQAAKKNRRQRHLWTAEGEAGVLRRKIHRMTAWIILLALLLAATGTALVYTLWEQEDRMIGRNYTYEDTGD